MKAIALRSNAKETEARAAYADLRNAGISIPEAIRHARRTVESRTQRLAVKNRKATAVMAGVKVTVNLSTDPLGWAKIGRIVYGELNDEWQPGCIATPAGSQNRFFHPSQSYWDMRREMEKQKMPKQEADLIARRLLKAQIDRALSYGKDWEYVTAYFHLAYRKQVTMEAIDALEFDFQPRRALEEMLYREAYRRAWRVLKAARHG